MEKFNEGLIWVKVINFANQTLNHDDFQLVCKTTGSLKKTFSLPVDKSNMGNTPAWEMLSLHGKCCPAWEMHLAWEMLSGCLF